MAVHPRDTDRVTALLRNISRKEPVHPTLEDEDPEFCNVPERHKDKFIDPFVLLENGIDIYVREM